MKMLLLCLLLFGEGNCAASSSATVYICDSRYGKKYHLSTHCRGLSTCSHRILKLSLEDAKKRGKTLCSLEK